MSEELKACPFCGSNNIRPAQVESGTMCRNCGTESYGNWNTRPIEDALQSEIARLTAENDKITTDIRSFRMVEVIEENARLTQRVRELEEEVKESNGLLRSTYQIAKRDGKDTNWEAFRNQVHIALVRQHEQMYGEESEEE